MSPERAGEWLPARAVERSRQIENGARQLLDAMHDVDNDDASYSAIDTARERLFLAVRPFSEWEPVPGLETP